MANVLTVLKSNRTKIWVGAVTLLLVFYLVVSLQRAVLLMSDANLVAKALGVAYLVLPVIGAWALIRELLFGARTERMAKVLEAEGGLPEDTLPRTPGGRIIREAADREFEKYRAEAEAAPADWRSCSAAPTTPPATASGPARPCATPCGCSAPGRRKPEPQGSQPDPRGSRRTHELSGSARAGTGRAGWRHGPPIPAARASPARRRPCRSARRRLPAASTRPPPSSRPAAAVQPGPP
jgi:hypothetical protein